MRYLLISLTLLFLSCASYPKKNNLKEVASTTQVVLKPYFSDPEKDYVYKANITVYDKNFGGIFIVKKIIDDHHRVAFTTEMGSKIFDFSFEGEEFKVNAILEEMDKKLLINILKKDFRALIKEKLPVLKRYRSGENEIFQSEIAKKTYFVYKKNGELTELIRTGHGKEKVAFHFSEINDNIAKKIKILHKNIKLDIKLTSIN